jgi:hypothetical protein
MKKLIYIPIIFLYSLSGFSQERPDTVINLTSWKQFDSVKTYLEKKLIAFSWDTEGSGGANYGKKGTRKSIEYRYENATIVTRRKGGEILF